MMTACIIITARTSFPALSARTWISIVLSRFIRAKPCTITPSFVANAFWPCEAVLERLHINYCFDPIYRRHSATIVRASPSQSEQHLNHLVVDELQDRFSWIEALEESNITQLYSFIAENDQWESMEEEGECRVLESKDTIRARLRGIQGPRTSS